MTAEVAFQIAGIDVLVRSAESRALAGIPFGGAQATGAAPALIVELELAPELGARPFAPDHPAFARRIEGDRLRIERSDAEGWIELAGDPVRAWFRVSEELYAREACLRVALSIALPRRDALILHASAVEWDGAAHVFTGVSGAGKSTIARILASRPRCRRLADELLVLAREPRGWTLHVPPLIGVAGLPIGESAPLASIDLLVQAGDHHRERLAPRAAMRELLRHVVVYAAEAATTERVLGLVERLVADVPCHRLAFRDDPTVAPVLGLA